MNPGLLLTPERMLELGSEGQHCARAILLSPSGELVEVCLACFSPGLTAEVKPGPRREEWRCRRGTGPPRGDLPWASTTDGRKGKARCAQPTEGTAVMAMGCSPQAAHPEVLGEPSPPPSCAGSLHPHNQHPTDPCN